MCENCRNLFDIKKNLPYLIPCGHTICERCLNALDFTNNKMKCPIDSRIYFISKEKIPKNEMLIEYSQSYSTAPRYSYQIRECVIEEATFAHMDRRNIIQKFFNFIYVLIYVKIFLTIINIILWPFRKVYQIIKEFCFLIYILFLKLKEIFLRFVNKIKGLKLPGINIYYKYIEKIKNKLVESKVVIILIKIYKYTIRAPLWINYLTLMKNLVYKSQSKANNICFKIINIIMALIGIFFVHLIAYFTNNLANFIIILLLLNESTIILMDLMKMEEEKSNKKYFKKIIPQKYSNKKENSEKNKENKIEEKKKIDEINEEYFIDEIKYHRGKKCIMRWIGFIIFWYFSPILKENLFNFIKYLEYSKDIDLIEQEKNIQMWTGVIKSLLSIPKLIVLIYLTY